MSGGMFETGEPYRRDEIAGSLRRLDAAGESFLVGLPPGEFFAPQGNAWSPAEHVRHLTKSARPLARAMGWPRLGLRLAFGTGTGPAPGFADLRQRYLALLAAGGQAGRFAPTRRPPPTDPDEERCRILSRWHEAHAALEQAMASWDERALDRYRLPHPLLGRLTVREMLAFTVYHTAHHLRRVAERRGEVIQDAGV